MSYGYPTNFFQAYDVIKKIAGIWLPGNEYHIAFRLLQLIYVLIFHGICIIVTIGVYMMAMNLTDVDKIASHLGLMLTALIGNVKFSVLALGHAKLKKLTDVLQDKNYQYFSVEESNPGSMFTKEKNVSSFLSYSVLIMDCSTGIFGNISTFVQLNNELEGDTFESTNKTCVDFLPFMFCTPFPTDTKWRCILVSNMLCITVIVLGCIHAAHDGLLSGLLNCLKTQLLIIGDVFKTIRRRSLVNINMSEDYSILHDEDNPALEEEMYRQLTYSTEHLKIMLTVRDEIDHIFTFVLLTQVLSSLLILASNLYVTSSVSITSSYFFVQMVFLVAILIQLSFMCWYGNEIGEASASISLSLYESDWFSCSPRFKRSMILTMIRIQRPVYLSIGKFSPLTIATLVTVCRGSYSYFTLFRSIQ